MAEETITAQNPEIDPGMSVMPEGPGLMDVPTVIPELGLAAQALASQVSFAKKTWKDGSGGGTPVTAAELNRLEQGVADLTAAVNALRDSVSRMGYVRGGMTILDAGEDKDIVFDVPFPSGMSYGGVAMIAPMTSNHNIMGERSVQVMAASSTSIRLRALSSNPSMTDMQVRWVAVAY